MNISINPFKNRNVAKKGIRQIPKANISAIKNKKLHNKMASMQNSLDYMASHFNINFYIYELPISKECFVTCQKGKNIAISEDIGIKDENSTIARKIYEAVSKVLKTKEK